MKARWETDIESKLQKTLTVYKKNIHMFPIAQKQNISLSLNPKDTETTISSLMLVQSPKFNIWKIRSQKPEARNQDCNRTLGVINN